MAIAVSGRKMPIGGLVAGLGGVVSILGAFLPAQTASANGLSISASFFDGNAGKTICVAAIVALVLVGAWLTGQKLPLNKVAVSVVIILAGAVVLLVVAANYGDITDGVNLVNKYSPGAASVGMGLYLTLVGGILLAVGGVLGLVQKDS